MRKRLLLAAGLMLIPAAALAQSPQGVGVTLTPDVAGKPSRLELTASGETLGSGDQAPKSISVLVTRGLKVDPRSRAGRCSAEQSKSFTCPADSRVATGSAEGVATVGALGTFPFTASIEAFLAPKAQPGDVAGVVIHAREPNSGRQVIVRGRILPAAANAAGPYGVELRFEDFDAGEAAPPGASAKIDRFEMSVEARRTVRRVRIVKRRVKTPDGTKIVRRRVVRRLRFSLITNPPTCRGAWPYRLRATFPGSPDVVRDGSVACTKSR